MMTLLMITAEKRLENGPPSVLRNLRASGRIPAVVYGLNAESLSVHVDDKELTRVARTGRSEMFKLKVEGMKDLSVIIKDFQKKSGKWNHVDFLQISESVPLRIAISIDYQGIAAGSKFGGVVQTLVTELEVEGLPAELPSIIEIDISHLEIGDKLVATDVKLPKGITLVPTTEELLLALVAAPRVALEGEEVEVEPEAINK
ncbi:50S ribosomal protein L25 [Paenibacillus sp. FA6]|uniref:50S ribosomal protein L25 n=1 Tax=Paenibacillus sp. FA6 TaxID=3413029 RepID=UPI003F658E68